MKLFLSALLLAAVPAVFTQNQPQPQPGSTGSTVISDHDAVLSPAEQNALETAHAKARAEIQAMMERLNQTGCPIYLESASVAPHAAYLPAGSRGDGGALHLHFRNQSGKAIASASITARFNGKRSIYQLDASDFDLRLTIAGVDAADKTLDQMRALRLPKKIYLYGVAMVTLDQVTFVDSSVWTAPPSSNVCRTGRPRGPERVESK